MISRYLLGIVLLVVSLVIAACEAGEDERLATIVPSVFPLTTRPPASRSVPPVTQTVPYDPGMVLKFDQATATVRSLAWRGQVLEGEWHLESTQGRYDGAGFTFFGTEVQSGPVDYAQCGVGEVSPGSGCSDLWPGQSAKATTRMNPNWPPSQGFYVTVCFGGLFSSVVASCMNIVAPPPSPQDLRAETNLGDQSVVQAAMDSMMANMGITLVNANATATATFVAQPTGTGTEFLSPRYLRKNPSQCSYTWVASGSMTQVTCPP